MYQVDDLYHPEALVVDDKRRREKQRRRYARGAL